MRFQNREHESNLIRLMLKDKSNPKDMERLAMFYILAGNSDLYSKLNQIYCTFVFNGSRLTDLNETVQLSVTHPNVKSNLWV